MALKSCSECDQQVSSKAQQCPGCGARTGAGAAAERARLVFILVLFIAVILIGWIGYRAAQVGV